MLMRPEFKNIQTKLINEKMRHFTNASRKSFKSSFFCYSFKEFKLRQDYEWEWERRVTTSHLLPCLG